MSCVDLVTLRSGAPRTRANETQSTGNGRTAQQRVSSMPRLRGSSLIWSAASRCRFIPLLHDAAEGIRASHECPMYGGGLCVWDASYRAPKSGVVPPQSKELPSEKRPNPTGDVCTTVRRRRHRRSVCSKLKPMSTGYAQIASCQDTRRKPLPHESDDAHRHPRDGHARCAYARH